MAGVFRVGVRSPVTVSALLALSGRMACMKRNPALDGLRALAVMGVLAFHLAADVAAGGFLGVTVFFVLSGFLITGLLLAERHVTGRIDLRAFYARRALRLFPALGVAVVLAAILAIATGVSLVDVSVGSVAAAL